MKISLKNPKKVGLDFAGVSFCPDMMIKIHCLGRMQYSTHEISLLSRKSWPSRIFGFYINNPKGYLGRMRCVAGRYAISPLLVVINLTGGFIFVGGIPKHVFRLKRIV